jgi:hypothetical protein
VHYHAVLQMKANGYEHLRAALAINWSAQNPMML